MTPLTFFLKTLWKSSAVFLGVAMVFTHPTMNWSSTQQAVKAQKSPTEAAVDGLIATLKDTDAGVRRESAAALGRIGNARAVAPLTDLLKDGDVLVRRAAGEAIAKLTGGRR